MQSVIIADDEHVIVDGFVHLVNWERLGCEIVAIAYDGIMAMNEILRLKPDIVVIDINMPLMTGLEVIKRVSPECPKTSFFIISGYDEFNYIQTALKLRVQDYLLKPVDFPSFEELILGLRHPSPSHAHEEEPSTSEIPLINRIIACINEQYMEPLTLKRLARQFYMNPNYLSQFFKNQTGMNYNTYLNQLRIERAKQLLLTTGMSIVDIAAAIGCQDYRTFTKKFHQTEGVTPSTYRKQKI